MNRRWSELLVSGVTGCVAGALLFAGWSTESSLTPSTAASNQHASEKDDAPSLSIPQSTLDESVALTSKLKPAVITHTTLSEDNRTVTKVLSLTEPQNLTTPSSVSTTLQALNNLPLAGILAYTDQFKTHDQNNVYLPAVFKAAIQQAAILDFDAVLDHVLSELGQQAGTSHWDNLALSVLAEQQPGEVSEGLALVAALFDDVRVRRAFGALAIELDVETAAQSALESVFLDPESAYDRLTLDSALNKWVSSDPQAALHFVRTEISDQSLADSYTADLLYSWLEHQPEAALTEVQSVLEQSLAANPDDYLALGELYVDQLSATDPMAAYSWLQNQENDDLKATAIDSVFENWLDTDYLPSLDTLAQINLATLSQEQTEEQLLQLTESVILVLVQNGKEQQATRWINEQRDSTIAQYGQSLLDKLL